MMILAFLFSCAIFISLSICFTNFFRKSLGATINLFQCLGSENPVNMLKSADASSQISSFVVINPRSVYTFDVI